MTVGPEGAVNGCLRQFFSAVKRRPLVFPGGVFPGSVCRFLSAVGLKWFPGRIDPELMTVGPEGSVIWGPLASWHGRTFLELVAVVFYAVLRRTKSVAKRSSMDLLFVAHVGLGHVLGSSAAFVFRLQPRC